MCFWHKNESYFFIRNNALEKSSKHQIICLLLLLPMKISYCLQLDLDLLLHTVNTIILCYEIVPKSAYALPRRAARTESCRLYGSSFTIHMSLAYWKMRWTAQTDACGWGLHGMSFIIPEDWGMGWAAGIEVYRLSEIVMDILLLSAS